MRQLVPIVHLYEHVSHPPHCPHKERFGCQHHGECFIQCCYEYNQKGTCAWVCAQCRTCLYLWQCTSGPEERNILQITCRTCHVEWSPWTTFTVVGVPCLVHSHHDSDSPKPDRGALCLCDTGSALKTGWCWRGGQWSAKLVTFLDCRHTCFPANLNEWCTRRTGRKGLTTAFSGTRGNSNQGFTYVDSEFIAAKKKAKRLVGTAYLKLPDLTWQNSWLPDMTPPLTVKILGACQCSWWTYATVSLPLILRSPVNAAPA